MSPAVHYWVILLTNTAFACLLAWAIPALIFKVSTRVDYLQDYQLAALFAAGLVSVYGIAWAADAYTQATGGLTDTTVRNAIGVLFLGGLVWQAHRRYLLLNTLHPQATLDRVHRGRAQLLARLQLLDQHSPLARLELRGGDITFANPAAARLYGYDGPEDLVGLTGLEMVYPEDRDLVRAHAGDARRYECRVYTAYGRLLSIEVTPAFLPDEPDVRIVWAVDVTDHVAERDRLIAQARDHRLHQSYAESSGRIIARTAPLVDAT